jgi:3'-phosphoadenosine 5'-phosphosulfate sulfotransferase (PAPS reductase)/FAD synthetase
MFFSEIIKNLKSQTNEVILFHSGTGKDSIMLLDLCSKSFDKVVCVFMYIVKDLDYENKYIKWAENKYPNCEFIQTPHYCLYSFIKHGYLGIKKDESFNKMTISRIDDKIRLKTGINYSVYGFKKNDGITRRLMLNSYKDGICHKTKKAYPLMDLKNSDVINYIQDNNLITPFNYGTTKPSSGCDISTPEFLAYLRVKYPNDLKKIFTQFPLAEVNLFKFDNYGQTEAI